eukprot:m.59411 g.59411  ORF g.59411 m.59411 type:complete len:597 (+) comp6961_c0_seq1:65-1855(+)
MAGSWEEVKAMMPIIWPVVLGLMFQMSLSIVNLGFMGKHASRDEFDAAGLALTFTNVFGQSVGQGLATACDTLCSQAYGRKNHMMIGLAVQRGAYILALGCICCWSLWLNAAPILNAINLSKSANSNIVRLTSQYCFWTMPMLPGSFLYTLLQKYLQAQGHMRPGMVVAGVVSVLNVLLNYVLLDVAGMGIFGSAMAYVIANLLLGLLLLAYIVYFKLYEGTWPGWTKAGLLEWGAFARLAVPGMAMLCLEWWSFEMIQIFAAELGPTELGAQVVVGQIMAFNFMIPLGISIAASVRVGNLLGANQPTAARRTCVTAVTIDLIVMMTTTSLIFLTRPYLVGALVNDRGIRDMAVDVLFVICGFQIVDSMQVTFAGVLRGCGRQKTGATVNLLSYYALGLPLAYIFGFHLDLGMRGLWYGMCAAVVTQVTCYIFNLLRQDWDEQARLAQERTKTDINEIALSDMPADDGIALLGPGSAADVSYMKISTEEPESPGAVAPSTGADVIESAGAGNGADEADDDGGIESASLIGRATETSFMDAQPHAVLDSASDDCDPGIQAPVVVVKLSSAVVARRLAAFGICLTMLITSFIIREIYE